MKAILLVLAFAAAAHAACTITGLTNAATNAAATSVSVEWTGCAPTDVLSLYHVNRTGQNNMLRTASGVLGSAQAGASSPTVINNDRALTGATLFQNGAYFVYNGNTWSVQYKTFCNDKGTGSVRETAGDAYAAPTFVAANSKITIVDNKPALKLQFTADKYEQAVAFEFLNGGNRDQARCGADFNLDSSKNARGTTTFSKVANSTAGNGLWTLTSQAGATCNNGLTYEYNVEDYNNALANCGWTRDEADPGATVFQATVLMTTLQQGKVIRNVLYSATLETAVQLGIKFLTNVSATTGNLRVFGPRIEFSTLFRQTFDPVNYCARWGLLTSVQGPYQLYPKDVTGYTFGKTNSAVGVDPAASTFSSAGTEGSDAIFATVYRAMTSGDATNLGVSDLGALSNSTNDKDNTQTARADLATCLTRTKSVASYADATGTYEPCNQYWFLAACKPCTSDSTTDNKNLNYNWNMTFSVVCHKSFGGSCSPSVQDNTVTVSWATYSDNYCPQIIDTESSQAVLSVYQDSDSSTSLAAGPTGSSFSTPQTQYVFGTYSYFETVATSSIKISDLEYERISFVSGGASTLPADGDGNLVVFKRNAFTTPTATWWGATASYNADVKDASKALGPYGNKAVHGSVTSTFEINKNVSGVSDTELQRRAQFQWIWGSSVSSAAGDFPVITQVQVDLRVRYTDQNAPAPQGVRSRLLSLGFHANQGLRLAADGGASASARNTVSIQVAPSSSGDVAPISTGASEAAVSTQTIVIGAAVVGGVALVAAGVAVSMRKGRKSRESNTNVESVQLSGSASTANF